MAGRGGVDLETRRRVDVVGRLHQPGAERERLLVRRLDVVDVQVEMQLLRRAVARPVWRPVVGRQLEAEPRLAVDVDGVPVVLRLDPATEEARPEGALDGE